MLLRWARDAAGLSLETAAKKLTIKSDALRAWESDDLKPTIKQLRKAANVYKRPVAIFYLPQPPTTPEAPHDFRRLPGESPAPYSSDLLLEIRRARRRRTVALDLLAELGTAAPSFTLTARLHDEPEGVAGRARRWLGVSLAQQADWTGQYDALNGWTAALEERGVLVFQTGDVRLEEMRGFSLTADTLPVIVLNGKDTPRGRAFTLMHELGHLMLHREGACDPGRYLRGGATDDERIEVFCNRLAGEVLVPSQALLAVEVVARHGDRAREWADEDVRALADRFAVSREVIVRRLVLLGRASEEFYAQKREEYLTEYRLNAERRSAQPSRPIPVFRMKVRDNGRRYTRLVLEALDAEHISYADVSDYLGVRLQHLEAIATAVAIRNGED